MLSNLYLIEIKKNAKQYLLNKVLFGMNTKHLGIRSILELIRHTKAEY